MEKSFRLFDYTFSAIIYELVPLFHPRFPNIILRRLIYDLSWILQFRSFFKYHSKINTSLETWVIIVLQSIARTLLIMRNIGFVVSPNERAFDDK